MNREILFKAKRKDGGKWVEGYYEKRFDVDGSEQHFIFWSKSYTVWEYAEIAQDTLCQYTGLTDKNGKKIWENDICEMVYNGVVYVYVVVWDKTELDFKGTNGKENYGRNFEYLGCCEEIEVIGNIFDNPELLEVE